MIERYGVDAYFLDIVGGHVNSTNGDMHEGTRSSSTDLRAQVSESRCASARCRTTRCTRSSRCITRAAGRAGQKYSAVLSASQQPGAGPRQQRRARVGLRPLQRARRCRCRPNAIPTLQVVDDTFTKYRDVMAERSSREQAARGHRVSERATDRRRSARRCCERERRDCARRGLAQFTFGNASAIDRDRGLVVIKPSGVPYEQLRPEMLIVVDLDGDVVEGALRPSSDLPTHLVLYRAFPRDRRRRAHALALRHGVGAGGSRDSVFRHDARRLLSRRRFR